MDVLIGADTAEILFTGQQVNLNCGVSVIQTKLGWTLMRKLNLKSSSLLSVATMF